jgi:hypothetical protein
LPDDTPFLRRGSVTFVLFVALILKFYHYVFVNYGLLATAIAFVLANGIIALSTYLDWTNEAKRRKSKNDIECPSSGELPELHGIPEEVIRKKEALDKEKKLLEKVFHAHVEPAKEAAVNADGTVREDPVQKLKNKIANAKWGKHLKDKKVHHHLDMDHVKVSYFDSLKTMFMLLPNSALYAFEGVVIHGFFSLLIMLGIKIFQKKVNYEEQAVEMMLETSICTFFSRILTDEEAKDLKPFPDSKIAVFDIKEPIFVYDQDTLVHDMFRIWIDVVHRKFVKATLDDAPISAKDTSILTGFILITSHHVKIHAYANWGIDPDSTHPYLRWLSTVTVAYNRYGYDAFPHVAGVLRNLGFLSRATKKIQKVFDHGLKHGVRYHPDLVNLSEYSDFVRFIYQVRGNFLNEFSIVRKEYFPGINGEAYFVGTVIHSLDHTQYLRIWRDSTWADCDDPAFKHMANVHGVVICGFSGDLPLVMFKYRFKDLQLPFFQNIYHHAYNIDPYFANHMDATIIK